MAAKVSRKHSADHAAFSMHSLSVSVHSIAFLMHVWLFGWTNRILFNPLLKRKEKKLMRR